MNMQDLKAKLAALKANATKVQKEFINLILQILDKKAKATHARSLSPSMRTEENKPFIQTVLDLLCRFGVILLEHEVASEILRLIKTVLIK